MTTQEQIKAAETIYVRAQSLADRWRKAWRPGHSYNLTGEVRLDFQRRLICFRPGCSDGVSWGSPYPNCEISFDYLEDDSTLEKDASNWYEAAEIERLKPYHRQAELEKTPEVREWKELERTRNGYGYIGNNVFIGHRI
jgi:hypothetical protein